MFDDSMYTQLLAIIDLVVKQAIITTDSFETEFVSMSSHSTPYLFTFSIIIIFFPLGKSLIIDSHYFLFILYCIFSNLRKKYIIKITQPKISQKVSMLSATIEKECDIVWELRCHLREVEFKMLSTSILGRDQRLAWIGNDTLFKPCSPTLLKRIMVLHIIFVYFKSLGSTVSINSL